MKEVISERAKIREFTAEECEDYYNKLVAYTDEVFPLKLLHMEEDVKLCNKQYLQLTGNPLF